MKIDLSKIVTTKQYEKIGIERYNEIKKMGRNERFMINNKSNSTNPNYCQNRTSTEINKRAHELAFKSHKYKDLTVSEKEILKAEIFYTNTDSFCSFIMDAFSSNEIENISIVLDKFKKIEQTRNVIEKFQNNEKLSDESIIIVEKIISKYEDEIIDLEKFYAENGYSEKDAIELIECLTERIKYVYGTNNIETYINRLNGILTFEKEKLINQKHLKKS